jgi:hypothetical protein
MEACLCALVFRSRALRRSAQTRQVKRSSGWGLVRACKPDRAFCLVAFFNIIPPNPALTVVQSSGRFRNDKSARSQLIQAFPFCHPPFGLGSIFRASAPFRIARSA